MTRADTFRPARIAMSKKDDDINFLLSALTPTLAWRTSSVEVLPKVKLRGWDIKKDRQGNLYFVGHRSSDGWLRVSTAIVEFDAEERRGRTQSGRVYELLGPPGLTERGEVLWSAYKSAAGITEADQ